MAQDGYPPAEPSGGSRADVRPSLSRQNTAGSGHIFGPPDDSLMVGSKLGKGGQGSVHLCTRLSTGSKYAVKIINVEAMKFGKRQAENLRQEIRNMSEMHHPRIVNLHTDLWEGSMCFLVMDLCSEGDLHNKVESQVKACPAGTFRGLGGSEVCTRHVAQQLVDGIGYMHSKHIVHRDMKLENVLISKTTMSRGTPSYELHSIKIADLGLSKNMTKPETAQDTSPTLERRNSIVGSPDFVAPEVLEAIYDERADLWSLGVMVYAMFCGQWPFEIKSPEHLRPETHKEIVANIRECESWKHTSDAGKAFVRNLLKVDPDERLQLEECKDDPWLFPDKMSDAVSVPRDLPEASACRGVVKKISGWSGAALDSVTFKLWNGASEMCGKKGGEKNKEYKLGDDEIVLAVMQETREDFLGNGITLYTSRRVLTLEGTEARRRQRFIAPRGHQVVALQFQDSCLAGIIVEHVSGSGECAVKEISGRVGYAVDKVELKLRSGEVRSYGEDGGTEKGPFELDRDEYIVIVEQGLRDAFLGTALVFYTSKSNIFKLNGIEAGKHRRLMAPVGYQIIGLGFAGSRLTRAACVPADGDMSKMMEVSLDSHPGASFI